MDIKVIHQLTAVEENSPFQVKVLLYVMHKIKVQTSRSIKKSGSC